MPRPERLILASLIAPPAFVVGYTLIGRSRPGYDPMRHSVSLLSLTSRGWTQTANFLATGALIAAGGRGLWRAGTGAVPRAAAVGTALAGAGLVTAGIFRSDPVNGYPPGTPEEMPESLTAIGAMHLVGAFLFFGSLSVAPLLVARGASATGDAWFARYSAGSALVVLVATVGAAAPPGTVSPLARITGLTQRLAIVTGLSWIVAVSLRAMGGIPMASGPT